MLPCHHTAILTSSMAYHSNALYLLVTVSQRLMFAQESGSMSYLDETLKKALVFVKRLFDKFIVSGSLAVGVAGTGLLSLSSSACT